MLLPFILVTQIAFAEEKIPQLTTQELPLTQKQITKLKGLFKPSSGGEFQMETPHEHVIWNQTPIDVTLPINTERMVVFPTSIQFGYDKNSLGDDILKVQNNNGVLYFAAKKEFPVQRVQVKLNDSGKIILLNLSAKKDANNTPLDVVVSETNKDVASNVTSDIGASIPHDSQPSYVTLTRFAVQQLYAPKRLLVQPPNIFRTPMRTQKTVPLLLDGSVMAMPLASWRGGDLFVTAVLLRNLLQQPLKLDPRNLNGHWITTTFFPQTELAPRGDAKDSTTVFLVSNRPFAQSFN